MTYTAPRYVRHIPDPDAQPEFYAAIPTKRLLAWVVDSLLIFAFSGALLVFSLGLVLLFLPPLMLTVGFVYRTATLARGSATWGMALMAVEMRQADGSRFDGLTALLHTLGYTLSIVFFFPQVISILMMLTSPRAQGLSDVVLGTVALNRRAAL